jgi:peptide/nickel transport system substrate-binding protein
MSLSHEQAQNYLEAAADDMLGVEATEELQNHLAACAECRAYAAKLEALETLLSQSLQARWPSPEQADSKARRTAAVVQAHLRKRQRVQHLYNTSQTVAWAGLAIALALVVGWLLTSISPQQSPSIVEELADSTVTLAALPAPTATATPGALVEKATPTIEHPPEEERTLTVCQGYEPESLYFYSMKSVYANSVLEAVYDGPIDSRTFDYQPVILEKLPSLADGDAVIKQVTVQANDWVVDDSGEAVVLQEGVRIRPAGCYSPYCAVTFDGDPIKMEQLVVTFSLKPGILWSDGEPLTAYDSVYSFKLDQAPQTPGDKEDVSRTARYQASDDYTVVWTGLPGYRNSEYRLQFWTPMPEHAWGKLSAQELLDAKESTRFPLGWGPYVVKEWVLGSHITLVKNENYWRANEGLPYLDRVIFRFVGDSASANVAALLSGECDIVDHTARLEDQSEMLLELQSVGKVNATFVTGATWEHLNFGIIPAEGYERPNFFSDVRVRQAIAHCIDRQKVVDKVLFGQSRVLHTYLASEHPLFEPDAPQYKFDIKKGSALLTKSGWVDDDENPKTPRIAKGIEDVPDGTPLIFSLATTSAPQRQEATKILQDSLVQCGVQVKLEYIDPSELFADGPDGVLFGRQFDTAQFAWMIGPEPPCELYLCSQVPSEENDWQGVNLTGFCHADFDAACTAAQQSLPGEAQYEQAHKKAQRIFAEQLPAIPLYSRPMLAATRPDLKGFIMDPTARSEFWNIEEFDYEE